MECLVDLIVNHKIGSWFLEDRVDGMKRVMKLTIWKDGQRWEFINAYLPHMLGEGKYPDYEWVIRSLAESAAKELCG